MCLVQSNIRGLAKWNWDGDVIVHLPVVPSSRPVVGYRRSHEYDIDVREFLVTDHNALVQKTLREDVAKYVSTIPGGDPGLFSSRDETSFDYRAFVISSFVSEKIAYKARKGDDPWQFPDETLYLKYGDCEDRAFLLASLLMGAGISPYNIRVALGKIRMTRPGGRVEEYDHMWVMYKNEAGEWTLLEPLRIVEPQKGGSSKNTSRVELRKQLTQDGQTVAEYRPSFLFNDSHLWAVANHDQRGSLKDVLSLRKRWKKFNPKFAGEVHQTILHAALAGMDQRILNALDQYFSRAIAGLVGPIVDDIDRRKYNPLDHFDNAYIPEGWELVEQRLATFRTHNTRYLDKFALAAHAIADFYAHSSYGQFGKVVLGSKPDLDYLEPFDHSNPVFENSPEYTAATQFDLTSGKFSVNTTYWDLNRRPRSEIAQRWKGQLISGRYGQKNDTWPSIVGWVTEGPTQIPIDLLNKKDSRGNPDFPDRGSLPHHNEIAVDEQSMSGNHILYSKSSASRTDRMSFENQFRWRKNAAIRHIRSVFQANWNLIPIQLTPLPQ